MKLIGKFPEANQIKMIIFEDDYNDEFELRYAETEEEAWEEFIRLGKKLDKKENKTHE